MQCVILDIMNEINNPQLPAQQIQIKKGLSPKLLLLVAILFGCLCGSVGFVSGFVLRGDGSANGVVSPTPALVTNTPVATITVTVTPTETAQDPDTYEGWISYILSDCQIRLKAPAEWQPGKRGEFDTCGSFKAGTDSFTDFTTYEGLAIFFMPFLSSKTSESLFAFDRENSKDYISNLDFRGTFSFGNDFLLDDVQTRKLNGKDITQARIERKNSGIADYIFYSVAGRDYVIAIGGTDSLKQKALIDDMLASIEFIEPLNTRTNE